MKTLLTTTCLFVVTTIAIVSFTAPPVFGQAQKPTSVEGSKLAAPIPAVVEWRFDQAQPDWKLTPRFQDYTPAQIERTTDALRLTLPDGPSGGGYHPDGLLRGGVYVDLPGWRREEWAEVVVRARTTSSVNAMTIGLNPIEGAPPAAAFFTTFQITGGVTPIVRDGLVRTYRIHLDWGSQRTGPWRRVGLWFRAPEPGSIDILSVSVVPKYAQDRVTETTLELPQLKSDFALFRKALEEAHAGLYRWTTKREMDAEFARAEAKLNEPMTILQFRNVLMPVVAAIRCGHTLFTSFQGDEISTVLNSAKQFPLALKFESMRGFVVLNQGLDGRVKPGMEVLAINGEPLAVILRRILPNVPHDGDIRTNRMYVLGFNRGFHRLRSPGRTGFSESYRLYIGNPASFKTTLRDPHTRKTVIVELAGVTNAEAAVNAEKNLVNRDVLTGIKTLQAFGEQQSIRYLDGESTAILRIPGFRDFDDFLAKSFAELKSKGTKNLIIDLQGNSGGRDASIPLLFSYLAAKEFRIYERIHMTTYQPTFKQYTDREFTPATGFPEFSPAFGLLKPDPNGGWLLTEKKSGNRLYKPLENHAEVGQPAVPALLENPFDGAVYVLMDGGSFSAAADFVATAAFHKRATFIGEETGGVAEGNNSGVSIGLTLPESHLHIGIPLYRYDSVVDKGNRRRGTLPTHAVTQTIDDLAKGRDTVLEYTLKLIRSGKGR
ncbi:MAG: S41 family peptidase [Gemmatimonadota bacterium]|nr:S41 family peptidase [Gemmatimonadota bacterium]